MGPVFPGMDPYLEAPDLWPDVHLSLSVAIRDLLQPLLSPRYAAVLTPYVALESIAIAPARLAVPDVGVLERERPAPAGPVTAIAPDVPTRYQRIEVRTVGDEALVTAIELLSPVNKRPGAEAADAYERKHRELFPSMAHLLEIDLLRGGRRPALLDPLPDAPYFVFLSRVERRPVVEIWPLPVREPIPQLPVPLRPPDPDVPLDLTQALARVYSSARYDLRIDYRQAPPSPELPPEDAAWLDAHLRAQGLR